MGLFSKKYDRKDVSSRVFPRSQSMDADANPVHVVAQRR